MKERALGRPRMLWRLGLVLCTLVQLEANAQNLGCNTATEQPTVLGVNPPSGTTGQVAGVSSTYTIRGERLDRVSRAEISLPFPLDVLNTPVKEVTILQRNSTEISFQIARTTLQRREGGNLVTLVIYPDNTACQNISLNLTLHDSGKCTFRKHIMWVGLNIFFAIFSHSCYQFTSFTRSHTGNCYFRRSWHWHMRPKLMWRQ